MVTDVNIVRDRIWGEGWLKNICSYNLSWMLGWPVRLVIKNFFGLLPKCFLRVLIFLWLHCINSHPQGMFFRLCKNVNNKWKRTLCAEVVQRCFANTKITYILDVSNDRKKYGDWLKVVAIVWTMRTSGGCDNKGEFRLNFQEALT